MTRPSGPRAGLLVAVGTAVANVLAYGLSVVLSRQLGPDGFGQVAPLLAVVLVASVPGQALQAGIARRLAGRADGGGGGVLAHAVPVGVAVSVALLALTPVLVRLLALPDWAAPAWTALSLAPLTVCFAALGVVQGQERMGRLAAALVVVQAGRLGGGTVGVLVGGTPAWAMAGTAVGLVAAAVGCLLLAGRPGLRRPASGRRGLLELGTDTAAMLAVLTLSNVDVLLARNQLAPDEAGWYAAGALVAKAALYAPLFASTVLYPRFARPEQRGAALRTGALVLTASAGLAVTGAVALAPVLTAVLGDAYRPVESSAWMFAVAGSAWAGVLLLVYAGLAVHDRGAAGLAWLAVAVEVVVVVAWADTLREVAATVMGVALVVVAVGAVREHRRSSQETAHPVRDPAGRDA